MVASVRYHFVALLVVTMIGLAVSQGISHASHLMLKAAEQGDKKTVVDYITKTGVPLSVKNNFGVSAIIFAANNGHLELLKALVGIGANIEDRSNNWRTPLNWAAYWGHYDCVEYLVSAGANVSTFDSKGMTPLMSATLQGHPRIVQFLLDHGADPLTKNVFNGTALSIARVQNNTVLVSLLEPYYSEDTNESSPYIIMYNILRTELGKLAQMAWEESLKLYAEAKVLSRQLYAEGVRRWEESQESKRPRALQPQSGGFIEQEATTPDSDTTHSPPIVALDEQSDSDTCPHSECSRVADTDPDTSSSEVADSVGGTLQESAEAGEEIESTDQQEAATQKESLHQEL